MTDTGGQGRPPSFRTERPETELLQPEGGPPLDFSNCKSPLRNAFQADRFIGVEPPAREWTVTDFLPRGITGLLAAPGGTGKSMLFLALGSAVAAGMPFLGHATRKAKVLYVSGEEDADELHRRWAAVMTGAGYDAATQEEIGANLTIAPVRGHSVRFQVRDKMTGGWLNSPMYDDLLEMVPHTGLTMLDPKSRFFPGASNDDSDATAFVEYLEALTLPSKTTVLVADHVSKAALQRDETSQADPRGSSAFVDGVRWVAVLASVKHDKGTVYTDPIGKILDPDKLKKYWLRLSIEKANGIPPGFELFLNRRGEGYLDKRELKQSGKGGNGRGDNKAESEDGKWVQP